MDGSGPSFSGKVYSIINMVMTLMSLWLSYSYHNFRFFTGCCCFIPCVMDGFHDYEHMCPQCNAIIGKSTPDDREEERKKGLKIVIGTMLGTIICSIVFVILYFVLVLGVLSSAYSFN